VGRKEDGWSEIRFSDEFISLYECTKICRRLDLTDCFGWGIYEGYRLVEDLGKKSRENFTKIKLNLDTSRNGEITMYCNNRCPFLSYVSIHELLRC